MDYENYYLYSLIIHSTAIEGSTLTGVEAQLLFDESVVTSGKPFVYHLMNEDLKNAYERAKEEARYQTPITSCFLQTLNATLMSPTGSVHNVTLLSDKRDSLSFENNFYRTALIGKPIFTHYHCIN